MTSTDGAASFDLTQRGSSNYDEAVRMQAERTIRAADLQGNPKR